MFIKEVKPSIIKNSRKEKTIQVEIETLKGKFKASAPSGKSKGKYETPDYNPKGIEYSLKMLQALSKKLKHKNFMIRNFSGLKEFEVFIKKFEAKYGLFGANSTYALETAFLKASAKENKKELWQFVNQGIEIKKPKMPMPVGNCIGGGKHSEKIKTKKPDFQEFLLIPKEKKFSTAITKMIHAYEYSKKLLKKKQRKFKIKTNDENALHASLTNEEVLDILQETAKKFKTKIGLDIAASTFFHQGYYNYENKKLVRDRKEQIDYINHLIKKYNLFYIEDPLQEEDFSGFLELTSDMKSGMIVGDDLTVTNPRRLLRAVQSNSINAMIIKPNQNGSLLQVARIVQFCKKNKIKIIFSHRSGETMDDALADYAVGFGADFIKTGIMGKERLIKLRRVMEIEKSLIR